MTSDFLLHLIDHHVRRGVLTLHLLKPVKIDFFYLSAFLGPKCLALIRMLIIVLIFSSFIKINPIGIIFLLLDSLLIFLLSFYFAFLFASISFKTEASWGIFWGFRNAIIYLLSGGAIPIPIMRKVFRFIDQLPFKYMLGVGYEVYLRRNLIEIVLAQIFWIIVFYFLANLAWKRMLRHYRVYGC
jgi:ABC-type uncharacterized transport system permease subunit